MQKIKTKVVKEAVRVYEFMKDYDKLRTGRMLKTSFPRALDLCALGLTASEITTVMEWLVISLKLIYLLVRSALYTVSQIFLNSVV